MDTETLLRKQSMAAVAMGQLRQIPSAEPRIILKKHSVALYVDTERTPIIILLTKQVILGRGMPNDDQMRIDLTPYYALEKGVSRQHAILKRTTETTIVIEDMGGINGTWLNDILLQPYRAAPIASGDDLRLAKMRIAIYLP
jgi:hypothetical protein